MQATAITNSASRFEVRLLRASNFEDAICILQEWGDGAMRSLKNNSFTVSLNVLVKGLGPP